MIWHHQLTHLRIKWPLSFYASSRPPCKAKGRKGACLERKKKKKARPPPACARRPCMPAGHAWPASHVGWPASCTGSGRACYWAFFKGRIRDSIPNVWWAGLPWWWWLSKLLWESFSVCIVYTYRWFFTAKFAAHVVIILPFCVKNL